MSVVGLLLVSALSGPQKLEPALWLHPKGSVLVDGKETNARATAGAKTVRTPFGLGLDLDGRRGGLLLADQPALALTGSMTAATWIYLRSYRNDQSGAQVLFRGDDRDSLDPYSLVVHPDGTINFAICSEKGDRPSVSGEIPLNQWIRVTASFDSDSGEMRLWLDDRLVAHRFTSQRPLSTLDAGTAPGIGIGNVQNDKGPHNQPLNGTLADLRLYRTVLEPREAGWTPRRQAL